MEYRYRIDGDGTACIMECSSCATSISIPETLEGHEVCELGERSFAHLYHVERITCPKGLRRIGHRAFEGCVRLREVTFNEGLVAIGEGAFAFCHALAALDLPASLESFGVNLAGTQGSRWHPTRVALHIPDRNKHLIIDDSRIVYERTSRGTVLVDGSQSSSSAPLLRPDTIEIGHRAFSTNAAIETVILPEGVTAIGREAFRSCTGLVEASLPESLTTIGSAAFSRTALNAIRLPARCVHIEPQALVTGPVVTGLPSLAYRSPLGSIEVDPRNPVYCMRGAVLCERIGETGMLRALLCPAQAPRVELGRDVASIDGATFAGTVALGTLRLHERIRLPVQGTLLPHRHCERLEIELEKPQAGADVLCLDIPNGAPGAELLGSVLVGERMDLELLCGRYDEMLLLLQDQMEQARLVVARLASPVLATPEARQALAEAVAGRLPDLCKSFGEHNYWQGFDQMMDAGLLNEANITDTIRRLSSSGDTPAVGYLLNIRRERLARTGWDYDL